MGSIISLFSVHNCGDQEMSDNDIPVGPGPYSVYLLYAGNMISGSPCMVLFCLLTLRFQVIRLPMMQREAMHLLL
jgi:hypothetical protein